MGNGRVKRARRGVRCNGGARVRLWAGLGMIGASVVVALTVGAVLAITPQQVDRGELAYAQH